MRTTVMAWVLILLFHVPAWAQQGGEYRLGSGDRVRITVFGEKELSGEFAVSDRGTVSMPLIGDVHAAGKSLREFEVQIVRQLKPGYLRNPKVSVEVINFRPFYIIGEVQKPGSYPYVAGMTVMQAVALAGGFTHRARESSVVIRRALRGGGQREEEAGPTAPVFPGDTVRVKERFF
jgi:protein involved in polysaccharide export with SLBB domain